MQLQPPKAKKMYSRVVRLAGHQYPHLNDRIHIPPDISSLHCLFTATRWYRTMTFCISVLSLFTCFFILGMGGTWQYLLTATRWYRMMTFCISVPAHLHPPAGEPVSLDARASIYPVGAASVYLNKWFTIYPPAGAPVSMTAPDTTRQSLPIYTCQLERQYP